LERLQTAEIMSLLRRQNFRCALTGERLAPDNAALDHIKPICRGGDHTIENIQALTDTANRAKGSLTQDEFIQLCRDVVAWSDRGLSDDA
jgi:5-methylcytosine-specific restriction endonuclease McrA